MEPRASPDYELFQVAEGDAAVIGNIAAAGMMRGVMILESGMTWC